MTGENVLIDTGPLVALLVRADSHHDWAVDQFAALRPPALTCESVLTEACYIVSRHDGDPGTVMELVTNGVIEPAFDLKSHARELLALMRRYRNVPMSLADASLVRMSEQYRRCLIMTTDTDFRLYRRNGRLVIPLIAPW